MGNKQMNAFMKKADLKAKIKVPGSIEGVQEVRPCL